MIEFFGAFFGGSLFVLATGDTFINDCVRNRSYGGLEALFCVGNATNTIFVIEAFPVPACGGGDGGDDGGDGGGVPATTGIGVVITILSLLGGTAYFMRRRTTT
jgi:hypothetical protein